MTDDRSERTQEENGSTSDGRARAKEAAAACLEVLCREISISGSVQTVGSFHQRVLDEVRKCIVEYVAALRAISTPPERALIFVKSIVTDTFGRQVDTNPQLVALAVKWTIDSYYSAFDERGAGA